MFTRFLKDIAINRIFSFIKNEFQFLNFKYVKGKKIKPSITFLFFDRDYSMNCSNIVDIGYRVCRII